LKTRIKTGLTQKTLLVTPSLERVKQFAGFVDRKKVGPLSPQEVRGGGALSFEA